MAYNFNVDMFENKLMELNNTFSYHEFAMCIFKSYDVKNFNTTDFINTLLQDKKIYPELAEYFEFASLYFLLLILKQQNLGQKEDYIKIKREITKVWSNICKSV